MQKEKAKRNKITWKYWLRRYFPLIILMLIMLIPLIITQYQVYYLGFNFYSYPFAKYLFNVNIQVLVAVVFILTSLIITTLRSSWRNAIYLSIVYISSLMGMVFIVQYTSMNNIKSIEFDRYTFYLEDVYIDHPNLSSDQKQFLIVLQCENFNMQCQGRYIARFGPDADTYTYPVDMIIEESQLVVIGTRAGEDVIVTIDEDLTQLNK